jgi:hypothetical protein
MLGRVLVVLVLCLAALSVNSCLDVVLHPSVSADVAVNQLEDDEFGAAAMRSYDRFYNAVPVVSWGCVVLVGLAMFRSEIVEACKRCVS